MAGKMLQALAMRFPFRFRGKHAWQQRFRSTVLLFEKAEHVGQVSKSFAQALQRVTLVLAEWKLIAPQVIEIEHEDRVLSGPLPIFELPEKGLEFLLAPKAVEIIGGQENQ
jgi:hypothetical protein